MFAVFYLLIGLVLAMVYIYSMGDQKKSAVTILALLFVWPLFVYYIIKDKLDEKEKHKVNFK